MNLLDNIKEAGIIGAGGAGFPTHGKLSSKAEFILLNGAECEPLLRVDQQLLELYPEEIIKGLEASGRLINATQAIIGIKRKHKQVISILKEKIEELKLENFVKIGELPDVYPAGDEQVLVYELTGRIVPEVGIPINVGCVVINAETALNIHKAAMGQSVTEKYLTLAGDIPSRITLKVAVGTPIKEVLKLSGVEKLEEYAVIDGGPMMGPVLNNLDGFISKKNKGFVILKKNHPLIRKKSVTKEQARRVNRSSCEQCRMCTDMCPRFLLGHGTEPHKMMRALNYKLDNVEEQKIAQLCCQCNLCELFSCPAGLFPKAANNFYRDLLAEQKLRYQPKQEVFKAREARAYRQLPSKRLIARLGLRDFDKPAPFTDIKLQSETVSIATSQHVGAPAIPTVKAGESVDIGQLIGRIPEGSLGANIHSSIAGIVSKVDNDMIVVRRI